MISDPLFDVADEIVVITGASGQLGCQYSKAFLERGAHVAALDLHLSEGATAFAKKFPERFLFCQTNVTDKTSLQQALECVKNRFGIPTVLVCNAAIDSPPSAPLEENGPFETYPETSWDKVMDVNLKGMFLCCQIVGGAMAESGKGSIINIASIYGVVAPDQSIYEYRRKRGEVFFKPVAYSASKSGVLNLTRYLAAYWGRKGVRVNSLSLAGVYNNQEHAFLETYCRRIPVGRMAAADEYNGTVLFLASNASSYMTGANLLVDGGWTAI